MTRFPYVQQYRDNRGTYRRYFRRSGVRVALHGEPGTDEFVAAYAAALSEMRRSSGTVDFSAKTGSIDELCASFYASPAFRTLNISTQRTYRSSIEPFRKLHGKKPFARLERKHISAELATLAATPAQANKLLKRIRQLLNHAIEMDWIKHNPAIGIRPYKTSDGFKSWPEELIELFESRWPIGTKPRLALDILLYTAQRRSDVVQMARSNIRDGAIRVVQKKTGEVLWIPIHARLSSSIEATNSPGLYLLNTEHGRPFSAAGFGNWFRAQCDAAGIPKGYSAHGLRKAAGRRLADANCTPHQIMAVLGHRSLSEATRYTKGADQRLNAQAAIARIGTKKEPELSSVVVHVSSKRPKSLK